MQKLEHRQVFCQRATTTRCMPVDPRTGDARKVSRLEAVWRRIRLLLCEAAQNAASVCMPPVPTQVPVA